jgi:hypothetical protein
MVKISTVRKASGRSGLYVMLVKDLLRERTRSGLWLELTTWLGMSLSKLTCSMFNSDMFFENQYKHNGAYWSNK